MRKVGTNMEKELDNQSLVQEVKEVLSSSSSGLRIIVSGTPTDSLQVVNRKYVTRNFTTALRPTTSILGEFYFDTTKNLPVWWNGTNYQDASGNVV